MYLSGGTFRATPAVFTISATKVDVLDASLTVDGSLESSDMVPLGLEAAATGSIGAEMAGWMSRQIGLPDQLLLRSPLQPAKGRVSWKKDGDVGVRENSPSPEARTSPWTWFGRRTPWKSKRSSLRTASDARA